MTAKHLSPALVHPYKILLIDDTPSAEDEIGRGLRRIGIDTDISLLCPTKRELSFGGCEMPSGNELDEYDLALVDLELFPILTSPVIYSPDDLRGGTEMLPYLRLHAPWLPLIAYSKLLTTEASHILPIACGFGFDGHAQRLAFSATWFTNNLWITMLNNAVLLRKRAVLGQQYNSDNQALEIDISAQLAAEVSKGLPLWREILCQLFHFAKKLSVEKMSAGWSGAFMLHVFARHSAEEEAREGEWAVKLHPSPSKLHQEIVAHLKMMRAGVEFARAVPLLWTGVVAERGVAGIVYQFAKGTCAAADMLDKITPAELINRLQTPLMRFYHTRSKQRSIVATVVKAALRDTKRLFQATQTLPDCAFHRLVDGLASGDSNGLLGKALEYNSCLIHGDLHLGNIMVGDGTTVLIDFALSRIGPISADFAKLAADILIRRPEYRDQFFFMSDQHEQSKLRELLKPLSDLMDSPSSESSLFRMLTAMYLAESIMYDEVSDDTKIWIKSVLTQMDSDFRI